LDPRFKFEYYTDHNWDESYISEAKSIITETWENEYRNITGEVEQSSDNLEDDLLSYVFKRCTIENKDELKTYLCDPTVSKKTDVLLWWKVI
jgi:hypothetical protein